MWYRDLTPFDWILIALLCLFALAAALHVVWGLQLVIAALIVPAAAAWVQAIGSIGAIGIAIYISHGSERAAKARSRVAAVQFVNMAEERIGGIYVVTKPSDGFRALYVERFFSELEEVQLIGRSIDVGLLEANVSALVLEMRVLIPRAMALSTKVSTGRVERAHRGEEEIKTTLRIIEQTWERAKEIRAALARP